MHGRETIAFPAVRECERVLLLGELVELGALLAGQLGPHTLAAPRAYSRH